MKSETLLKSSHKFIYKNENEDNLENLKFYIDSFSIFQTVLLTHEDSEILSELYYYLKTIWKCIPSKIT